MGKESSGMLHHTVLVIASLLFTLLSLELYFRIFDPQTLYMSRPDPVLGWVHVANMTGYRNESCLKTTFHFNSEGMRDVEHTYDKPPGVYRIAVIGDSFVNAQEVDLEDTFFRRLQHILRGQGYNVEVLGFGVRGFGTDQEYRLLENFALKYLPDLVVLAFVSNDVRNNSLALEKNPAKPYFELAAGGELVPRPFTPMPDYSESWKSFLFVNSHLLRFVYFRAARITAIHNTLVKFGIYANVISVPQGPDDLLDDTVYRDPPWPPEWEASWDITRALLRKMQAASTDAGADFILFFVTSQLQVSDEAFGELQAAHPRIALGYDNLEKRLATFSSEAGISCVTSLPAMRALQATGTDVHPVCDGHWTRAAHHRAAEILTEYLLSGDYFQR